LAPQEVKDAAVELIRANGYRCDQLDFFLRHAVDRGYTVRCGPYPYELKDVGGNWRVTVRE
jgi:hypothetical protein